MLGETPLDTNAAAPITIAGRPQSLADRTVAALRQLIMLNQLQPGARLNERDLVERLGVSRTPVRDALKILAGEGLILLRPNRAAIVAPLDLDALQHLFEMQAGLESFAIGLAAQRMSEAEIARLERLQQEMEEAHARGDRARYVRLNQRTHALFVEAARNPLLLEAHGRVIVRLHRMRNVALSTTGRVEESIAEHRDILLALKARDTEIASRLLASHIMRTAEVLKGYLDN